MHNPRAPEPAPVRPPAFVICEIVFQIKPEHLSAYSTEYGIEGLDNALADLREHLPEHLSAALVADYMIRSFTAHSITTRVGRGGAN
jgi:hypothetical protein